MDFDTALKLAQDLGYAERNPSADVDGHDACRKICILASLAFGRHIHPENVHTEGITAITPEDVDYAANWGGVIKLIGRARKTEDGKVECLVAPSFVHGESQLANIDDVFNGVLVRGNATGDVVFWAECGENIVEPFENTFSAHYVRVDGVKARKAVESLFVNAAFLNRKG